MSMGMLGSAVIGAAMDIGNMQAQKNEGKRNFQRNKEMADYMHDLEMKKWEKTNYKAQVEQMKKAGLNVGLMSGGGGQPGQSTASAGNPSQNQDMRTGQNMLGIMDLASQVDLNKASAEKLRAEADNLRGVTRDSTAEDVRGKKFNNDINEKFQNEIEKAKYWNWATDTIKGEEANAAWEFKKAIDFDNKEFGGKDGVAETTRAGRARIAELKMYEEDLRKAKADGNIAEAEEVIREFEASMAKQGISTNSPWYAKLITDLLEKVGLLDLIGIGQKSVKKEVQQVTK